MANMRSFGGVTASVWACVKATSEQQHGTIYDPPNSNQGTATTKTAIGDIVLSFNFDPSKDTVTYQITQKPFIVSSDQIWNGIQETIDGCQH